MISSWQGYSKHDGKEEKDPYSFFGQNIFKVG